MKYTESHEWVSIEGDFGKVGITNYAQKELGEVVYIELPEVGSEIKVGDEVAVLESTKAAADMYSPVSGEIIEVNSLLEEQSGKINSSSEDEGWVFKIKISDPEELEKLMDADAYETFVS